jgi:hypothetical protein
VWARLKRQIFLPAAVLHADAKSATVAVFDASKPLNQHKLRRNQIIPAFSDDLNNELTVKDKKKMRNIEPQEKQQTTGGGLNTKDTSRC